MKKILLVEDNLSISSAYKEILQTPDITVDVASDGYKALELINEGSWDILLLDIMIPKLDGFSILERLGSELSTEHKPVIVITNINDPDLRDKCLNVGATDFYVKADIKLGEFVDKIHNYIGANDKA